MTEHCAYGFHGPCPDTVKTCACNCHWEFAPGFTQRQKLLAGAFFVVPVLLMFVLAWKT